MSDFATMSQEEKFAHCKKISDIIKDGPEGINCKITVQNVCALSKDSIEETCELEVCGMLSPDKQADADACKEKFEAANAGCKNVKWGVKVMLGPGCKYQTIKGVVPYKGGDPMDLEHKEGEVWFVDFWATWCPPCQKPMEHNHEMLKRRGADWGGKLRIVCISIDQTREAIVKHIGAKEWDLPEHYHRDKSNCSDQYNVSGVPSTMLVDTKGMVVFKGHPANRPNLEKDFDDLLKGDTISGAGTEKVGGAAKIDGKELDGPTVLNEVDAIKVKMTEMQNDADMKAHAKKCPQTFCVIVLQMTYDHANDKYMCDYTNHRVCAGPKDSIEYLKEQMGKRIEAGKFELREQYRPM